VSARALFVYGTLMTGGQRALLLRGLTRRPASVRGALYHLREGYPAMDPEGDGVVHGELVDPPAPALLALLDHYEGVDEGLFQRVEVTVRLPLARATAWAWVMRRPDQRGGVAVPSGRWRARGR
jgi:gamma-glutamylcyclotransferase (GGCT)/AIG2-like uncharacterized protein YtfP